MFQCCDPEASIHEQGQQIPFVSLSRLVDFMKGKVDSGWVVTETNDACVYKVPVVKVTALRFTDTTRARIEKAGGECLTFDQLSLRAPLGQNTRCKYHPFHVL